MGYLTCRDCGKNFYTARAEVGDERCSSCGGELLTVGFKWGLPQIRHPPRTLIAGRIGLLGACQRLSARLDDGPCRDRTYDLEIKSLLLYQLS